MKKWKPAKIAALSVLGLVLLAITAAGILLLYLSVNEYRPGAFEPVTVRGTGEKKLRAGGRVSILSWNIGYGSLDRNQDFFMDGGTMVRPADGSFVRENMEGIREFLRTAEADVYFLQETDIQSRRSYYFNQAEYLTAAFPGNSAFAVNFLCRFIPYPFPEPIGKVESGLLTLNTYPVRAAQRIALPSPFAWPIRIAQLKRCLLVERIELEEDGRELVLVNLHLEAYDGGEGKAAQTKVLLDFLAGEYEKGNYCIAGGDFNQTFPGVSEERFPVINNEFFMPGALSAAILDPGWQFTADTETPSARLLNKPYPEDGAGVQLYVIDGFIVSPNVEIINVKTEDLGFGYSDHNPVLLRCLLR
ncbi:endonuclease/exonuclease/phosphatase family protein [Breznakiella homolactica]|uniref:Endonuclease/exonuclease/phosphatase family protein n=1 Tax=Breznakiella homolactica TaxID=2798577 RepID=A0A7T7XMG2_9SPIR|nr:endonuclease/exonuclease/phosphatase family protein [Breznakiella homolactica]QQO09059.1 endonuclease/exonuclease/phosphatase family protein [Breznakiella homolactica]